MSEQDRSVTRGPLVDAGADDERNEEHEGVPAKQLPGLFQMELISAGTGMLCTGLWGLGVIAHAVSRGSVTSGIGLSLLAYFRAFVGCLLASVFFALMFVQCFRGKTAVGENNPDRARRLLRTCSVYCVFGMVVLIWASGGPLSPFLALYVMTHTLTLSNVRQRNAPFKILGLFLLCAMAAVGVDLVYPAIPPAEVSLMMGGKMVFVGFVIVASSLVVSTWGEMRNRFYLTTQMKWDRSDVGRNTKTARVGQSVSGRPRTMADILWLAAQAGKLNLSLRLQIAAHGAPPEIDTLIGVAPRDGEETTLCFTSWQALRKLACRRRLLSFARLYRDGEVTVEGDYRVVGVLAHRALESKKPGRISLSKRRLIDKFFVRTPFGKFFANSIRHYSEPASLYHLFLDDYAQYTCAYWENTPSNTWPSEEEAKIELNKAQADKLDYIHSQLELKNTESPSVLDVGCGWGGLCGYFAERGVEAWGVTNSKAQAVDAGEFLKQHGGDPDHILLGNFLSLELKRTFSGITVVGMLEHVPVEHRDQFFEKVASLLRPGGRAYLQCIMKPAKWEGGDGTRFLRNYVFPGYTLEPLGKVKERADRAGFEVRHLRSDNGQYRRTATLWLRLLVASRSQFEQRGSDGKRFYREMTAYLAVACAVFADKDRGALERLLLVKRD